MGKKLYYTLVVIIALAVAGTFFIASIIDLAEPFGIPNSEIQSWIFLGVFVSFVAIILAGIADRQKD